MFLNSRTASCQLLKQIISSRFRHLFITLNQIGVMLILCDGSFIIFLLFTALRYIVTEISSAISNAAYDSKNSFSDKFSPTQ